MAGSLRCLRTLTRWPGLMRLMSLAQRPRTASTSSSRLTPVGSVVAAVIKFDDQGDPALSVDNREVHGLLRHPVQGSATQGGLTLHDLERIGQANLRANVIAPGQVRLDLGESLYLPRERAMPWPGSRPD